MNFDAVVARARVYPNRLLDGGTDDNVVVSAQSVDNDGEEVAFRREQPAQSARGERLIPILTMLQVKNDVLRVPNAISGGVHCIKIEPDLCRECEVSVVLGQTSDQVVILQQTRLGDEVNMNFICEIGAVDIPDLVRVSGIAFPRVSGQSAVHGLERASVGAE